MIIINRSALILLGGMATRAGGNPKYLFEYEGETFLSRQIRILSIVTNEIVLSCRDESQASIVSALYPYPCVIDEKKNYGPSEGIRVGASTVKGALMVVVACDMPLISADVIDFLFGRIGTTDAAVPGWEDGNIEPLHAIYRRDALIRYFAEHTTKKLKSITDAIQTTIISIEEIRTIDPDLKTFTNINDLQAFQSL